MTSREAFEAWFAGSGFTKYKDTAEAAWQAAIQHATEVAVKVCHEYPLRDPAEDGSGYWAANECADAIKEALK